MRGFGLPRRAGAASPTRAKRGELRVQFHLRTLRASLLLFALRYGSGAAGAALAVKAVLVRARASDGLPPRGPLERTLAATLPALGRVGKVLLWG